MAGYRGSKNIFFFKLVEIPILNLIRSYVRYYLTCMHEYGYSMLWYGIRYTDIQLILILIIYTYLRCYQHGDGGGFRSAGESGIEEGWVPTWGEAGTGLNSLPTTVMTNHKIRCIWHRECIRQGEFVFVYYYYYWT